MNARQFINTACCVLVNKSQRFKNTLFIFPKYFFPEFLKGAKLQDIDNPFQLAFAIYCIVFTLVFVIQGYMAHSHQVFFLPDGFQESCLSSNQECLKYFLGDYANLLNYTIIVEAYCISGCFFLIYSNKIDQLIAQNDHDNHLNYQPLEQSLLGGSLSLLFVLVFVLLGSAGYAQEIRQYPLHWYMNTGLGPVEFSGYYYLFVNFLLLQFVAFVGIAHLGMFKTAGAISKCLESLYKSKDTEKLKVWVDEDFVKKLFSPFATQVLISKIFVLSIILNMMSWKMWEPNVGIMNTIAIVVMVIAGMWIVTMPRYYIQYYLFKLRIKQGVLEYKDIRTPWILGGSAFVDIILVAIVTNLLLTKESIFILIGDIIEGISS